MRGALIGTIGFLLVLVSGAVAVPSLALPAAAGTVVTGQVRSAGHPVAGARVTLYVWPGPAVVAALKPGEQVPLQAVGSAVSVGTGQYAIAVTRWAAVRAAASRGVVNLEAMAVWNRGVGVFSFPRMLVNGPALAVDSQSGASSLAPQQATLGIVSGPASKSGRPPCGSTYLIKTYRPRWVIVGATYSKVPGVVMNFTYGRGQNSSLGVGLSATSETSGFSENGTYSISTDASEQWPSQRNVRSTQYKTEFTYGLFGVVCRGFQTSPIEWDGGATIAKTGPPRATYCVQQLAGSTFTKNTTAAFTFTSGVNIAQIIGIDLSAQTGYDSNARLVYTFKVTRQLCGPNGPPGSHHPSRLVAGLPSA